MKYIYAMLEHELRKISQINIVDDVNSKIILSIGDLPVHVGLMIVYLYKVRGLGVSVRQRNVLSGSGRHMIYLLCFSMNCH